MRRYSLKHEFSISDENCAKIKDCNVQIYICEQGIEKKHIMELLHGVAEYYNNFIGAEATEQNNNDTRKGWFIHHE